MGKTFKAKGKDATGSAKGKTNPKESSNGAGKQAMWDKFAKQAGAKWKKARETKSGGFEVPDIEDGTYSARIMKAVADFTKGNKTNPPGPLFRLQFMILDGDYAGTEISRTDFLSGTDKEGNDNSEQKMSYFAKTLDGAGYDISGLAINELPALAGEINKDQPYVQIATQTKVSNGKKYLTIYVNRTLTEDEIGDLPEPE